MRRDPVRPQAVAAVRVTVRNQLTGAVDDATVLAANGREISDTVGNLRFALTVQTAPTGDLTLQFRYDDGHGGSASEALTDAEPHVLSLEHATVTVARL
ncbi:hypothetical protein [Dyella sp. C9]|uniref:hypothetical protein n=1 Tax=Dyella sp. C9 TaxID=2202154 RepID=UPI00130076ED|nr:hypothetical protein [Dyella sp. C9]